MRLPVSGSKMPAAAVFAVKDVFSALYAQEQAARVCLAKFRSSGFSQFFGKVAHSVIFPLRGGFCGYILRAC